MGKYIRGDGEYRCYEEYRERDVTGRSERSIAEMKQLVEN